jgi:hypothetical protein
LEHECVEESCDDEELFEVYDNQDLFQTAKRQMDRCQEILEKIDEFAQKIPQSGDAESDGIDAEAEKEILRKCLVVSYNLTVFCGFKF